MKFSPVKFFGCFEIAIHQIKKHFIVGLSKCFVSSSRLSGRKKNRFRSTLLESGGSSKSRCSSDVKIAKQRPSLLNRIFIKNRCEDKIIFRKVFITLHHRVYELI